MKERAYPQLLGLGSYLPVGQVLADDALRQGDCSVQDLQKSGFTAVAVESGLFPADMALQAAARAMAAQDPAALRWLFYSHIHYQGHPRLWSPAAYVQSRLQAGQALSLNTVQGCNALMLSVDLACRLLDHDHEGGQVLCVAADRFNTSGFRRWAADYGIVYGDGAAAARLGYGEEAIADILAIASLAAPELEVMHRHAEPAPEGSFDPDDIRRSKKRFLAEKGLDSLIHATRNSLCRLWEQVATEAGVGRSDIAHLLLPHLGRQLLEENYLPALNLPRARSNIEQGLQIGHLGCADPLVGLSRLLETGCVSGELALLVGAGSGFSWTLCLVRLR
ncbi:3-oxoacyl-[acyl-carrier-protein] synthase III C-terminal domain-containing protein [Parachitinimonas caeni]|uniref:3-oxoacyl-[acyl-carrier-protein] synthase III C-terminal domain-containing protein n=1 Tax=Parachitinimonas caeni TaxID=3031301 RepID=A0ABT7E2Y7_9NEIS|nr:3-oxoacyl-[acyl-carrier-protein] synthase III C-terminal domain-containing protein [Parachitinimonas caeni]MDK2126682.1 3-oxoacyl-[acyl-carrier-protein] synthase III C-terminal domain-containing protein [Parachitinimonas caeni]